MSMILTIDPSRDLGDVARRLAKANLRVSGVLEYLHVIKLDADAKDLQRVRKVPGVLSVQPESTVTLDPIETPDKSSRDAEMPDVIGSSWRSPNWGR